jgi:hypothetical protein
MKRIMWSKEEKALARRAFEKAYRREVDELANRVKRIANAANTPEDIWQLHDFLTKKRRETDEKYDYRYSVLIWVFGRLIREGWIGLDDLKGLNEDKILIIKNLVDL